MSDLTASWLPTEEQIAEFLQTLEKNGYELRSDFFGFRFVGHSLEIYAGRACEGLFALVTVEGERPTSENEIIALDRFSNTNWFADWTVRILERASEMRETRQ